MKIDIFNTDKKYDIIYADPPWAYKVWSKKGQGRSAESHYHTMSKEDIERLPVQRLCNKDAVLFLWVTMPCLEQGLELIKVWGFKYKTCAFCWVKENKRETTDFVGLGYYTRANAELCLLATRGKPLHRTSKAVRQVIRSKIREHSQKPTEAYDRIQQLFGGGYNRLELFARNSAVGWDCWGDEAPNDIGENNERNTKIQEL